MVHPEHACIAMQPCTLHEHMHTHNVAMLCLKLANPKLFQGSPYMMHLMKQKHPLNWTRSKHTTI